MLKIVQLQPHELINVLFYVHVPSSVSNPQTYCTAVLQMTNIA